MTRKARDWRVELARGEAARAWCTPYTKKTIMDPVLAEQFSILLLRHMFEPHLGCATTAELLDEVRVRCKVNGLLNFTFSGCVTNKRSSAKRSADK